MPKRKENLTNRAGQGILVYHEISLLHLHGEAVVNGKGYRDVRL